MRYLVIAVLIGITTWSGFAEAPPVQTVLQTSLEKLTPPEAWAVTVKQTISRTTGDEKSLEPVAAYDLEFTWNPADGIQTEPADEKSAKASPLIRFNLDPVKALREILANPEATVKETDAGWLVHVEDARKDASSNLLIDPESGQLRSADAFMSGKLFASAKAEYRKAGKVWVISQATITLPDSGLVIQQTYGEYQFGAVEKEEEQSNE